MKSSIIESKGTTTSGVIPDDKYQKWSKANEGKDMEEEKDKAMKRREAFNKSKKRKNKRRKNRRSKKGKVFGKFK